MRVLVVGATGYIGSRLVGRLLAAGHTVRVLVRTPAHLDGHSWAPDRVEVWTVPDAGHVGGLATDPAGWHRRVGGFLATALAPGPST